MDTCKGKVKYSPIARDLANLSHQMTESVVASVTLMPGHTFSVYI